MGNKIFQGFMAFLGVILFILFVALIGKLTYEFYFGEDSGYEQQDVCPCNCDSVKPSSCLTLSTVFTDPADVIVTQAELHNEVVYIDEFRDMPAEVLSNVSSVLLKQRAEITIMDIINEYNAHKNVYDNLLQPQIPKNKLDKEPDPLESQVTTIVHERDTNSTPPNNGK